MMKKLCFAILVILLSSVNLKAENDKWQAGARSAAMGDASLFNRDAWSGFNNPASLSGINNYIIGFSWENRYLVNELSYSAFAFAMPVKSDVLAISYSRFGYSFYNENRVAMAYSKQLTDWLSMGLQFNYMNSVQPEVYGNSHLLTFDIGLLADLENGLMFGAHAFNPVNITFEGKLDEHLPVALRLGIGYWFSDDFLASVEAESNMAGYTIIKAGLEYQIIDNIYIQTGINAKPVKASFGLAYEFNSVRIDIAYTYHQKLGNSPHLGLNYAF